ncbi:MAG: IS66 family transposase [Terriglobia bacterium]
MEVTASNTTADTVEALKGLLAATQAKLVEAEDKLATANDQLSSNHTLIAHLELVIARMRHDKYGPRSERSARLLGQMELQLEELQATVTEDDLAAEEAVSRTAAAGGANVKPFGRRKPVRKPFPAHLPRERVVVPAPTCCSCCGGARLARLGEDVTETLEVIPRQWKVIRTVREKFTCRDCEKISQAPAPFHAIPRAFAGPSLLAMVSYEKFGMHMPLNRLSDRYAREGIDLSLSTLGNLVGATAFALKPLYDLVQAHVFGAGRLHADDTTVPVMAKHKTRTGRIWVYVRDEGPFAGRDPPAAIYYYSPDRRAEHPEAHLKNWTGILQSDAYSGYNPLSQSARPGGPIRHAFCWVHGRRAFYKLADVETAAMKRAQGRTDAVVSPIAVEAVERIDAIFAIERAINGKTAEERLAVRSEQVAPLVDSLELWMRDIRARMSKHNDLAKAIDYMLRRWQGFTLFLRDGTVCTSNNAAERALRRIACGRKSWMFCGSDRGGQRAAVLYSLIATCRMNDVDPEAWLRDVLKRLPEHPAKQLHELLPWNWNKAQAATALAA